MTVRVRIPERMDDPALPAAEHFAALAGLGRVNRWSRAADVLWPSLKRIAARIPDRPTRVLDIATGGGDLPVELKRRANRAGLRIEFDACDVSPTALDFAMRDSTVRFFPHDVVRDPLPPDYDAVTCSLFLHHLSDEDAVTVLRHMAGAGRTVLISDLSRGRLHHLLARAATLLLTRSPVVRFDGPASVRSAYTSSEAVALAARAGLVGVTVARKFPFRFLLTGHRP
jgi:SAM-dependent methyltransferase